MYFLFCVPLMSLDAGRSYIKFKRCCDSLYVGDAVGMMMLLFSFAIHRSSATFSYSRHGSPNKSRWISDHFLLPFEPPQNAITSLFVDRAQGRTCTLVEVDPLTFSLRAPQMRVFFFLAFGRLRMLFQMITTGCSGGGMIEGY